MHPPPEPYEPHPLSMEEREELAARISEISPEGRPADPAMGPRRIGLLLAGAASLFLIVGVVMALSTTVAVGVAMGAFGLVLFALNPEVWAAIARAQEREEVNEHQGPGHPHST